MQTNFDILIIGGGAAGFFAAINCVEKNPSLKVAILERGKEVLTKVRISGGGRCNVTHACFVPNDLVGNYPRGQKELRGPFHHFCTGDTIEWFAKHGVALKTEEDGRMFPQSNSSQTIIDCFVHTATKLGIKIITSQSVQAIFRTEDFWKIETQNQQYLAEKVVFATGSNPKIWDLLQKLGHSIVLPVPSLFTFNCKDKRIEKLMGLTATATIHIKNTKLEASGPLLITHWGFSGPAILRLSAWGARELFAKNYQFEIQINWCNQHSVEAVLHFLIEKKATHSKKTIANKSPFYVSETSTDNIVIPNRLWESLVRASGIESTTKWADTSAKQLKDLANQLTQATFSITGKSTFKEEFVTAGGVSLKEINFKTMESKLVKNLYFAGEVIDIDAITGGFNFQNAWTTAYIAAENCTKNL